uniref:Putative secreted protein n=1 Tax=Corethrella appendiculata TaxID=1370023 RepID=U5EDD7_9DIPT
MKNFGILLVVIFGIQCISSEDTSEATIEANERAIPDVFEKVNELIPLLDNYNQLSVSQAIQAKVNASKYLTEFHTKFFSTHEQFVNSTIDEKTKVEYQLGSQAPEVDQECLVYVRERLNMDFNLCGVGYQNCLNTADDSLDRTIAKLYLELDNSNISLALDSLLGSFRSENIFVTHEKILNNLREKEHQWSHPENQPDFGFEVFVEEFKQDLNAILSAYRECSNNYYKLALSQFDVSITYLLETCKGSIVEYSNKY